MDKIPGSRPIFRFQENFKGFAIGKLPDRFLSIILDDDDVVLVEEDQILTSDSSVQSNPPWGLDRIDAPNLPRDNVYHYKYTGKGVKVFIVDSGIRATHQDFGGRVVCGLDVFNENCRDGIGHGTHVAGTVGGTVYGVAKHVELVAVRMLDNNGEGTGSGLLASLEYTRQQKNASPNTPMIVNLSLGSSGKSSTIDKAVDSTVAAGLVVVAAAGNENVDACLRSPASAKDAITVAATDSQDSRASYSNFGSCVDIFAPGSSIPSAWISSDAAAATLSGTSMATPHVAGVAALYLDANPLWSPAHVWDAIRDHAVSDILRNTGMGSPNRLVVTHTLNQLAPPDESTDVPENEASDPPGNGNSDMPMDESTHPSVETNPPEDNKNEHPNDEPTSSPKVETIPPTTSPTNGKGNVNTKPGSGNHGGSGNSKPGGGMNSK